VKGIAHFSIGVAIASCFPEAVREGACGNPLYFLLGGISGLLPDTLDFKLTRFLYRHDMEVIPDPDKKDPAMIANAVALAVWRCHEERKPVRIKLDTIRLGADRWQQYHVRFDISGRCVKVRYGHIVDTGGNPFPGQARGKPEEAMSPLPCDIRLEYNATSSVDIFDGPIFEMDPCEAGTVVPRFIPWHRQWSHSLLAGMVLGLAGWFAFGVLAGIVMLAALLAHALADQLGHMGSNLLFPFRKQRFAGMRLMHSGDAAANLSAVWFSCVVIFWNLSRHASLPAGTVNAGKLAFFGLAVPAFALWCFRKFRSSRAVPS
jgi:hypothetical protein